MHRVCNVTITGVTQYSQSRPHETPKLPNETEDAREKRTWREKCNALPDGRIYIPAMAFKQAIDGAAKMVGGKIPGKNAATYSKLFVTGVAVFQDLVLPDKKDTVDSVRLYVNSKGVRGAGKRVWKYFPRIVSWGGVVEVVILDNEIPNEVFERVMKHAGMAMGVGRFRPENGGTNGRFKVESFDWGKGSFE